MSTKTSFLDKVAPLKTGHRTGPRKAKNWLSPEAVDAKNRRRRLERRWKASNAEPDRLAYRAACSSANKLITLSFAASNLERVNEVSKNPKRLWTTIKSILHSSPPNEQLSPPISQSLANSSVSNLSRLQLVQNTLARVVAQKSRFDHITPVLSELHWLPVRHRINFKIAAITHTVLQSQQPSYLAALIPCYAPVRSLRSSSSLSICVPLRKTSMAASRSFSSVAPKIWNALPGHLSSIPTLPAFRRALKHHFFLSAYPDSRTSGGITPSERITLRDTTPPAAIVLIENTMPSS